MACEFIIDTAVKATGGEILASCATQYVGVGTDSREDLTGKIFVALKGDHFDGHAFLNDAVKKGARCLIVHEIPSNLESLKGEVTIIKVNDTLKALQDLAKYWRKEIKAAVFGITGSNGKTSTKEFANTILSSKYKVLCNKGSYNNHWGVPLTILNISKEHEVALIEMGMNHIGELEELSKIASPNVVVCTTVGRAHIGNFNGSQQAVADAKEEIYLSNPKAIKIFNYDNEYTIKMFERVSKLLGAENTLAFSSFSAGSEVSLRATEMKIDGMLIIGQIGGVRGEATVPLFGRHNVTNLMAAACMGIVMKMEPEVIWSMLAQCQAQWGRGQLLKLPNGTSILFDAYNANPDSMAALVKNLFEINVPEGGKKIAILGEMFELGAETGKMHSELGEMIGQTDFDLVWFMGESADQFKNGFDNSGCEKTLIISKGYELVLANKVKSMLNPKDIVVIKGSRGMKLEQVMKSWDPQFVTK